MTRGLLSDVLGSIHKIYLLSAQHLILIGSKKQQKGGGEIIQISQKKKLFQSHKKLRVIWGNLTLYDPFLPLSKKTFLFPSFWPSRECTWHLFEKNFHICFSPLSPQAEQKEDDENFPNHVQMYVSKTFTKAKKSVLCAEYPCNELKIPFIQMENIFFTIY